jgi:hypothetical protein
LFAEATAPNPGHSWSELECTTELCVTSTGVGIGTADPQTTLEVNGNIIASEPIAASHVATKNYVDTLTGLTWPDGGAAGDTLIMGVTGPYWNSPLTWAGSVRTAYDCDLIGGTVYDTGTTGTICRYPGSTPYTGWTQAASWQRYSGDASWGGDACGLNKSSAPTSFANQYRVTKANSGTLITSGGCSSSYWNVWSIPNNNYSHYGASSTVSNTTTDRVEIGIY